MSLVKNKTLQQVEKEVDIFMFTKLIEMEFGSLSIDQMCIKLKEEFNLDVSEEDLRLHYEPTVQEIEEDYRLIYKNCVI